MGVFQRTHQNEHQVHFKFFHEFPGELVQRILNNFENFGSNFLRLRVRVDTEPNLVVVLRQSFELGNESIAQTLALFPQNQVENGLGSRQSHFPPLVPGDLDDFFQEYLPIDHEAFGEVTENLGNLDFDVRKTVFQQVLNCRVDSV